MFSISFFLPYNESFQVYWCSTRLLVLLTIITHGEGFEKCHTHTHSHTHTQTKSESNRKGKQQKDNETKSHCEGKTELCVTVDCRDLNMPWNCIKHPVVAKAMLLHNFASLRSAESRMLPVCSTGSGGHYSVHQVFHFPIWHLPYQESNFED